MPIEPAQTIYYRRARFTTRLPKHYRYAPSHYWLLEIEPGLFRIGITRFATRMLGDFVERELQVALGDPLAVGQVIGWIEGFKAVSDIFSVAAGRFEGANEELDRQPRLVDTDPYDRGWLYLARGTAADNCVDCDSYAAHLDAAIDRMLAQQKQEKPNC